MIGFNSRLRKLLSFLVLMLSLQSLTAQITVTGIVSDEITQETLIGATVLVKGTTTGTVTDIDGRYSLEGVANNATLVFSYVGYLPEEVVVDGNSVINVQLMPNIEMLSEMVVIGYGSVRKNDLTGSVAVVTADDLNRIPVNNFTQALQGRAAGVVVTQSGEPGENAQIRVRGIGSINRSSNPIYVIDGVITGSLNTVNPSDIESIQVLKDASSSAIYGADGSNGVIIINTKRGVSGAPRVDYSSYVKRSSVPGQFNLMNADEYAAFYNKVYEDMNSLSFPAYSDNFRQQYYGDGWQQGTNWQDEVTRIGWAHNHHIRVSGGGEGSNYSISANYSQEDAIRFSNSNERLNLRANSDFDLGNYIKIGETFSLSRNIREAVPNNVFRESMIASPLMKIYNEDNKGGFDGPQIAFEYIDENEVTQAADNTGGNDKPNPLIATRLSDYHHFNTNVLASVYMEVKPWEWLSYKITPSLDAGFGRQKEILPSYDGGAGDRSNPDQKIYENFSESINLSLENQLTLNQKFGNHNVTATAVHHVRKNVNNSINATAIGFEYEYLTTLNQGYPDKRTVTGYYNPFQSESYLGRLLYAYKNKYLLTASMRYDGNSRFIKERRWGSFPALSAAWRLEEDLLPNVEQLSMLKIRAGWGRTGNSNIDNFQYMTTLDPMTNFSPVFGLDPRVANALNVWHSFGNPVIVWESSEMLNFGADVSLLADKIQFSAEYYIKDQDNLHVKVPASDVFGRIGANRDPWVNLGAVQNRGFDFSGSYRKMEGDFHYTVTANLTTIKNEVIDIPLPIEAGNNKTSVGHTIGSFYGWVAERIIQESDFDADGNYLYAMPNIGQPSPGDLMFKDLNNDGIIDTEDRAIIGKPLPDFTYSFNLEMMYKNFDFSLFFYGMQNYQVYNQQRAGMESFVGQDIDHNKSADWASNYYRTDRPSTEWIRADKANSNQNDRISTWFLEDASFLKLKDIQLGYTLPQSVTAYLGMSSARIYVTAMNPVILTAYTGRDPESPTKVDSNNISPGTDNGSFPVPRAYTAGIQVQF